MYNEYEKVCETDWKWVLISKQKKGKNVKLQKWFLQQIILFQAKNENKIDVLSMKLWCSVVGEWATLIFWVNKRSWTTVAMFFKLPILDKKFSVWCSEESQRDEPSLFQLCSTQHNRLKVSVNVRACEWMRYGYSPD